MFDQPLFKILNCHCMNSCSEEEENGREDINIVDINEGDVVATTNELGEIEGSL